MAISDELYDVINELDDAIEDAVFDVRYGGGDYISSVASLRFYIDKLTDIQIKVREILG